MDSTLALGSGPRACLCFPISQDTLLTQFPPLTAQHPHPQVHPPLQSWSGPAGPSKTLVRHLTCLPSLVRCLCLFYPALAMFVEQRRFSKHELHLKLAVNKVRCLACVTLPCGRNSDAPMARPVPWPPMPPWCLCCSAAQSCPALCDHTDCSTPRFSVLHHLPESAQTHVH